MEKKKGHRVNWTRLNPRLTGFRCLRCRSLHPIDDFYMGCPNCLREGYAASVAATYKNSESCHQNLPFLGLVSKAGSNTPLRDLAQLASQLGVARLWLKDESTNPTGSHKDRLSPLVTARAKGLKKGAVTVASSGNAGLSLAHYAAETGLRCRVLVKRNIIGTWNDAMVALGAELEFLENSLDRWRRMGELVRNQDFYPAGNFCDPPVGSNPFGVQGYKNLAYELVEQLKGQGPDWILVPTSRGDLLWGIWSGLCEAHQAHALTKLPKMVAVEPFSRISRVLKGEDYRGHFKGTTGQVSTDGITVTFQSLCAIRESGGTAVDVPDTKAAQARKKLAALGIPMELCSASPLAAIEELKRRHILKSEDRVILIGTSSGIHDKSNNGDAS